MWSVSDRVELETEPLVSRLSFSTRPDTKKYLQDPYWNEGS